MGKSFAIRAQFVFRQVIGTTAVDPANGQFVVQMLDRLGMFAAEVGCIEAAGNNFRTGDVFALCERAHFAENVGDMAACIFRNAVTDRFPLQAAAQCQRNDVQQTLLIDFLSNA